MVRSSAKVLGLLAFAVVVCLGYLVGIVHFLATLEENKCDMTYMYEFPQYTDISISPEIDHKYKHYSLSAYSEGILTERVRKMKFSGIPVLFIPGHSGSGKQVRSIASVALRKSVDESHLRHFFDFFAVDFNGEYSALFGGVLEAQTQFVLASLRRIMTLYAEKYRPRSVVIIGHSMGGMIAKGLFLQEGFDPSLISTIITLATPHQPVVLLDTYLHDYYTKVNTFWSGYSHDNTSIVSIGGGNADIHVKSSLTKTDHVNICTSSSMIPAVWVSADHKSIVWCKRLIKVLVRILFDSIDPHSRHISSSVTHRNNVLKYHLTERFGGKSYRVAQNLGSQIFSPEGTWLEYASLQDTLEYKSGVRQLTHILIKILPLSSNPQHEMMAIDTVNVPGDHWLFACTASEFDGKKKFCQVGENLSGEARFLPSIKGKHLRTYLALDELRSNKHTHVLITIPTYYEYFRISYDIYRPRDRTTSVSLLSLPLLSFVLPFPLSSSPLILSLSQERVSLSHTLTLEHMQYAWLAMRVRMIPHCDPAQPYHQSVATVRVPWSNQNTHHVVWRNVSSHSFPITLYDPRPGTSHEQVTITFELDPSCRYLVTAQLSLLDSLRSFIFSYSPMLLSHMGAILLFLLAHQLGELSMSDSCSVFPVAMVQSAGRPAFALWVLVGVACSVVAAPGLPRFLYPDTSKLYAQSLDALVVPVLLYAMAVSCVVITGCLGLLSIVMWGKTVNSLAVGFLAKILKGSTLYSEWSMKILEKLPGLVAALMLSIALNTCGGLAFAMGICLYFLKLVLLYEEIFEKILLLPWNVLKRYLINRMKRYRQSRRAIAGTDAPSETNAIEASPNGATTPHASLSIETTPTTSQSNELNHKSGQSIETVPSQSIESSHRNAQLSCGKNQSKRKNRDERADANDQLESVNKRADGKIPGTKSLAKDGKQTLNNLISAKNVRDKETSESYVLKSSSGHSSRDQDKSDRETKRTLDARKDSAENTNDMVVRSDSIANDSGARPLIVKSNSVSSERPLAVRSDSEADDDEVTFRDLNFHFTLFLLWLICTLVSFPSTLVWAKNFGDTMQLSPDPMSTHAAIMSVCAALLWQADLPKADADYYGLVSTIVYMTGCFVLLYAQTSLYRLIPAICFVFVVICSHQTLTTVFRLRKTRVEIPDEEPRDHDESRSDRGTGRKFRASHFTSVARSEELVRDMLDSQLNCIYKRLLRPFRDLVCSRRLSGDSGDEISGDSIDRRVEERENLCEERENSEDRENSEEEEEEEQNFKENVRDNNLEENVTLSRKESLRDIGKKVRSDQNEKNICDSFRVQFHSAVDLGSDKVTSQTKEVRDRQENVRNTCDQMNDIEEETNRGNSDKSPEKVRVLGSDTNTQPRNDGIKNSSTVKIEECKEMNREDGKDGKENQTALPVVGNKRKLDTLDKELCSCSESHSAPNIEFREVISRPCIVSARNKRKLENLTRKKDTVKKVGENLPHLPILSNLHRLEAVSDDREEIPGMKDSCKIVSGEAIADGKNNLQIDLKELELKEAPGNNKEICDAQDDSEFGQKHIDVKNDNRQTVEVCVEDTIDPSNMNENVMETVNKSENASISNRSKESFGKVIPLKDRANVGKNHDPVVDILSSAGQSSQMNLNPVKNVDALAGKKSDKNNAATDSTQHPTIDGVKSSQLNPFRDENVDDNLKGKKIDQEKTKTINSTHNLVISQVNKCSVESDNRVFEKQSNKLDELNIDSTNIESIGYETNIGSYNTRKIEKETSLPRQGDSCDKDGDQGGVEENEVVNKQIETNTTGTKSSKNKRKRRNRKKKGNTTSVESKILGDSNVDNGNTVVNEDLLTDIISECDVNRDNESESSTKEDLKDKRKSFKSERSKAEKRETNLVLTGGDQATSSEVLRENNVEPTQVSDDASSTDSKQSSNDTNSSFCELTHADVEENQSEAD